MILRILVRFVGAVLFWRRFEGMSLRPFGADGVVDTTASAACVRCGTIHKTYRFESGQLCYLLWCSKCGTQMHEPFLRCDGGEGQRAEL